MSSDSDNLLAIQNLRTKITLLTSKPAPSRFAFESTQHYIIRLGEHLHWLETLQSVMKDFTPETNDFIKSINDAWNELPVRKEIAQLIKYIEAHGYPVPEQWHGQPLTDYLEQLKTLYAQLSAQAHEMDKEGAALKEVNELHSKLNVEGIAYAPIGKDENWQKYRDRLKSLLLESENRKKELTALHNEINELFTKLRAFGVPINKSITKQYRETEEEHRDRLKTLLALEQEKKLCLDLSKLLQQLKELDYCPKKNGHESLAQFKDRLDDMLKQAKEVKALQQEINGIGVEPKKRDLGETITDYVETLKRQFGNRLLDLYNNSKAQLEVAKENTVSKTPPAYSKPNIKEQRAAQRAEIAKQLPGETPVLIDGNIYGVGSSLGIADARQEHISKKVEAYNADCTRSYAETVQLLKKDLNPTYNEWLYIFYRIGVYTSR